MDYKPHSEPLDLKNDIMALNRTTSRMILSILDDQFPHNGSLVYEIIHDAITLDWSDKTHQVDITYTPHLPPTPSSLLTLPTVRKKNAKNKDGYITVRIRVDLDANENAYVDLTINFARKMRTYCHYTPIEYVIDIVNKNWNIDESITDWGTITVILRELIIQRHILDKGLYADVAKKNAPKGEEDYHIKWGLFDFLEQLYRAYDPSYDGPTLTIKL